MRLASNQQGHSPGLLSLHNGTSAGCPLPAWHIGAALDDSMSCQHQEVSQLVTLLGIYLLLPRVFVCHCQQQCWNQLVSCCYSMFTGVAALHSPIRVVQLFMLLPKGLQEFCCLTGLQRQFSG